MQKNNTINAADNIHVSISPIALANCDIDILRKDFTDLLDMLNDLYKMIYGDQLWSPTAISKGDIFNGDLNLLFNSKKINEHKTIFDDLVITAPIYQRATFTAMVHKLQNKVFGKFIFMGSSQPANGSTSSTNTTWEYKYDDDLTMNIKITWAFYEFVEGVPVEFAKFANSTDMVDVSKKIDGQFHKLFMVLLTKDSTLRSDVIILTDKSPLPPLRYSVSTNLQYELPINTLSFSADKGMRVKLQLQKDDKGTPHRENGKYLVKPLKSSLTTPSSYMTDVSKIFKYLFKKSPSADENRKLWSLVGVCELVASNMTDDVIEILVNHFFIKLWGDDAIRVSSHMDIDLEKKMHAWNCINTHFKDTSAMVFSRKRILEYYASRGE